MFFNIQEVKLTVSESANLVIRMYIILGEKARIPTKSSPNCVKKLVDLHHVWWDLQKNSMKSEDIHRRRSEKFQMDLDNLFDIAHTDDLERMKIEEDQMFLHKQREPGRPGCLVGVDKKIAEKQERSRQRKVEDEKRKKAASTSLTLHELSHQELDVSFLSSDEESVPETSNVVATDTSRKRGRKDFVSPKLVAALDR